MRKNILNKIRLISKAGLLSSNMISCSAMEENKNLEINNYISCDNYKKEYSKTIYGNIYSFVENKNINNIIINDYNFDKDKYYNFFSDIIVDNLDISNLKLANVKFNSFL